MTTEPRKPDRAARERAASEMVWSTALAVLVICGATVAAHEASQPRLLVPAVQAEALASAAPAPGLRPAPAARRVVVVRRSRAS